MKKITESLEEYKKDFSEEIYNISVLNFYIEQGLLVIEAEDKFIIESDIRDSKPLIISKRYYNLLESKRDGGFSRLVDFYNKKCHYESRKRKELGKPTCLMEPF